MILGSYGLRVISGEISLVGAVLKSSNQVHWVHAPYCYALPVLRCSDEAVVEIESHPAASSIRKLGALSPLFRRLWEDERGTPSSEKHEKIRTTFRIVRYPILHF